MRRLVVVLLLVACESPPPPPPPTTAAPQAPPPPTTAATPMTAIGTGTFDAYWPQFQAAVASGDATKAADLAAFPFTTRGETDDAPVKQLDRAAFVAAFPSWLAHDPGLSAVPSTMKALIASTDAAAAKKGGTDDEARVGDFVFRRTALGWRFAHAYTGE